MSLSKKFRKMLSLVLVTVVLSMLAFPNTASAKKDEEETFKNTIGGYTTEVDPADAIDLESGVTVTGDTSNADFDLYRITSEGSDTLTIFLSCKSRCVNLYLFDKKGKYVDFDTVEIEDGYIEDEEDTEKIYAWSDDTSSPLRYDIKATYDVGKGNYYIVVNPGWQDTYYGGPYRITAAFSEDADIEPEDAFLYEEEIFSNTIASYYTEVDPANGTDIDSDEEYDGNTSNASFDLYKIGVADDDTLTIELSIKAPNVNMYVFDRKGKNVEFTSAEIEDGYIENTDQDKIYAWSDDTSSPLRFEIEAEYEVTKGIYYIVICPGWQDEDYGGKYDFTASLEEGSVDPEDRDASTSVSGKKGSSTSETTEFTYGNYTFEVPSYWYDSEENNDTLYAYASEYICPMLFIYKNSRELWEDEGATTATKYKDCIKVLEASNTNELDLDFDSWDAESEEETYIAGYPALTYKGNGTIDYTNYEFFIASFIDDDDVYCIAFIDYDDEDFDIFADVEDILESFEEIN